MYTYFISIILIILIFIILFKKNLFLIIILIEILVTNITLIFALQSLVYNLSINCVFILSLTIISTCEICFGLILLINLIKLRGGINLKF